MEIIAFDAAEWDIQAKENRFEEYLGRQSLFLKEGIARLVDLEFLDGIIEYDVAFSSARGFVGIVWRAEDSENYEEFYMRPHQSGNDDALQYTPVYKGMAGWQLYAGEGRTANARFSFDQWLHVKLVVAGAAAELYIGEGEEPAFYMHDLIRAVEAGGVGLKAGPFTSAHFSNFCVTPLDDAPQLRSVTRQATQAATNFIPEWTISEPFAEALLESQLTLTEAIKKELAWEITVADDSGRVNLSRVNRWNPKKNSAFAQSRIFSKTVQIKQLQFGFSDKVKVYLNDQLLFAGNDTAFSRDYRFLGTMGYYDELYLALHPGENKLCFAVSEDIPGGWGIQARFTDMDGIAFGT